MGRIVTGCAKDVGACGEPLSPLMIDEGASLSLFVDDAAIFLHGYCIYSQTDNERTTPRVKGRFMGGAFHV